MRRTYGHDDTNIVAIFTVFDNHSIRPTGMFQLLSQVKDFLYNVLEVFDQAIFWPILQIIQREILEHADSPEIKSCKYSYQPVSVVSILLAKGKMLCSLETQAGLPQREVNVIL